MSIEGVGHTPSLGEPDALDGLLGRFPLLSKSTVKPSVRGRGVMSGGADPLPGTGTI